MVENSFLKYFLIDNESLAQYNAGEFADIDDIKRRMFLKAREHNRSLPDHYYRLSQHVSFKDIDSICAIFSVGIPELVTKYLFLDNKEIYIKPNEQNHWQELITYIPPLFLQCCFLHKKINPSLSLHNLRIFYNDYLLPNTKYTALPSAKIIQLEKFLNEQNGFHDLHMHLNGALETDRVWQDYLLVPNGVYKDLTKAFRNKKVKEQIEQESSLLNPKFYIQLLKIAQRLRIYFFNYLFPDIDDDSIPFENKSMLLHKLINGQVNDPVAISHPFIPLISGDENYSFLMSSESLMFMLLLEELSTKKNEMLGGLLHFYLLILGLTNRLLVQQTHQKGFEQFQKHTLNGLRERSEKTYLNRYLQMQGNASRNLFFLEGRYSPKSSEAESVIFLEEILKGWKKLREKIQNELGKPDSILPTLKLIAHFIKKEDSGYDGLVKFKFLRTEIWQKSKVLSLLLRNHPKYANIVKGVDAAASEFDTPPEVFGPVFRFLRRAGLKHFTFHAGEDFYHLISGLRAIYESIIFCDLRCGDRIGHATATALSAKLWRSVIGEKIIIKQGEYLDNLIFVYHLIISKQITSLNYLVPILSHKVFELCENIYGAQYSINILMDSWLMRGACPIHAFCEDKETARLQSIFNEEEWNYFVEQGFIANQKDKDKSKSLQVFKLYHSKDCHIEYEKVIQIDPFEIVSVDNIEIIQLTILGEMTKREIVIETLPTSNVRIGFHRDFSTYHLINWINWRKQGQAIPPIVVGSDDTGIFATNIYNEYANIYCACQAYHKMDHKEIMELINQLNEDSKTYRFS